MKILQVIIGLDVGGAEMMLKRLVESHCDASEFQHVVVSLTGVGEVGLQLRARGVRVLALEMRSLLDAPRILLRLFRLIRLERPDVVQTWMYHADLLGGLAARLAGNRNVIWGVRTTNVGSGNSRATTSVMRLCAAISAKIPRTIVCAAEAARLVHIDAGYDRSKMVVIANGFELTLLASEMATRVDARASLHLDISAAVVGIVGRFNDAKDHANFVRAAGLVADRHPQVRFLMVGRNVDIDNPELGSWIAATGHADRFLLLGERSDVKVCLAAMDIFCLSSRSEGFPNVLGEAMAMAIPCVTTDVGDAAMLVGDTGTVVAKESPAQLAGAISGMLALSENARRTLGQKAQARIRTKFSMERSRERFESIYKNLAGKGNS
jgi:glycosyltransferase involved in cell wall biosynthesis